MTTATGCTDFTKLIKTFDDSDEFPDNGKYAPRHFFRGALVGPSGCGKTNCLLSMILNSDPDTHVYADKIYVFAKDIHEPAYEMLKKILKSTEEAIREVEKKPADWKYFVMSDKLSDVPQVKDLDDKIVNLMVFDDWARDKEQNIIEQHYKMGRKRHCNYLYLSQSYFDIPAFLRKQLTHLFIWRLRSKRDVNNVLAEHNPGIDEDLFRSIYMAAVKPDYSFMMIDKTNPKHPLRQGFKNAPTIE